MRRTVGAGADANAGCGAMRVVCDAVCDAGSDAVCDTTVDATDAAAAAYRRLQEYPASSSFPNHLGKAAS